MVDAREMRRGIFYHDSCGCSQCTYKTHTSDTTIGGLLNSPLALILHGHRTETRVRCQA